VARMFFFTQQLFEGVGIALGSLRVSKMRAALTILGVAIGVMVVMVIAAMITGINQNVADLFEESGSRTFFVTRYFSGGITVSDGSDEMSPWRSRPYPTVEEADRIRQLPSIAFVDVEEYWGGTAEYEGQELESVTIQGRTEIWPNVSGGDVYPGRSFTRVENLTNSRVAVVTGKMADRLFGSLDPVGRRIKLAGSPFVVIGVYTPAANLFGHHDPAGRARAPAG